MAAKRLNKEASELKRLRVLVVDDEDAVREVVADTIQYAGHDVVGTAKDGAEAVTRARELKPDLVVMDIKMPQMNGVEAMRAILAGGTARWVMLISGEYRMLGFTKEDIMDGGAAAFMEKPFDVAKLLSLLEGWAAELDAG
jgi:CheY-like chemotaxis protein